MNQSHFELGPYQVEHPGLALSLLASASRVMGLQGCTPCLGVLSFKPWLVYHGSYLGTGCEFAALLQKCPLLGRQAKLLGEATVCFSGADFSPFCKREIKCTSGVFGGAAAMPLGSTRSFWFHVSPAATQGVFSPESFVLLWDKGNLSLVSFVFYLTSVHTPSLGHHPGLTA